MVRFGHLKAIRSLVLLPAFVVAAYAQSETSTPQLIMTQQPQPQYVANKSTLYCAGYIRHQRLPEMPEVVGALNEQEQRIFSNGDVVFVNSGSQQGMTEGQIFQIIRPRGDVKGVHKDKSGFLGTYIQEVGQLQVFKVYDRTSAARVTFTCDPILFGDFLVPVPDREAPVVRAWEDLDRFAAPSGKQTGRLMMAKDGHEMVTRNDVVYIDLGGEDQLKPGDYLTIYRPLGTGNLTRIDIDELARSRAAGFQSERYRGGGFSIMASRAKDSTTFVDADGRYRYRPITSKEVKKHRPPMPRKVVGEIVVVDVQARTATAIVTRVNSEVHTGDRIEIQ